MQKVCKELENLQIIILKILLKFCSRSSSQFRGILLQELAKNGIYTGPSTSIHVISCGIVYVGVRFDVRKLNVGDFLWIAKEKAAPLQGIVATIQWSWLC